MPSASACAISGLVQLAIPGDGRPELHALPSQQAQRSNQMLKPLVGHHASDRADAESRVIAAHLQHVQRWHLHRIADPKAGFCPPVAASTIRFM